MPLMITLTIYSLTSFYIKMHFFIIAQKSYKAEIVLYLSKGPYLLDEGVKCIPAWLISILEGGSVEVKWVENTGPYRKLMVPLCIESDDAIVVTADDDIIYGETWLESLLKDFNPSEKVIHASRVRKKRKNMLGYYSGYVFWPIIKKPMILSEGWVVTFGGGTVLCKSWFSKDILYDDTYLDIAPRTDDLWCSKIADLNGIKVRVVTGALDELCFFSSEQVLLVIICLI